MENLLLLVHLIIALVIIGLILLQQGKGAEMGASFGSGASQTLFGASGTGNFFARMTAFAAAVFFVTSITLAVVAKNKVDVTDGGLAIPELEQQSDLPTLDTSASDELPILDEAAIEEASQESESTEEASKEPVETQDNQDTPAAPE